MAKLVENAELKISNVTFLVLSNTVYAMKENVCTLIQFRRCVFMMHEATILYSKVYVVR